MHFDINSLINHFYHWLLTSGPKILLGIIILIVGLWLIRLFGKWSHGNMEKKNVDPTLKPFLVSVVSIILRLLLIFCVIQLMGFQLTIFTALVGAFGVAAGLALSGTLQNFASGVLILLLKPFVVNDNIITQGLEGTVTSIQIFYTIVRTFDNRTVIVPNSKLSNEVIINISREGKRRLDFVYKFGNAVDLNQLTQVINDTIDKEESILAEPTRRIGVSLLEKDGYTVLTNVWVNAHGYEDTRLRLMAALLQNIKGAGIKLDGL
ncbi:MAG: mechanosensitive ion channel family protein [Bacteroidota bacterium]